MKNIYNIFIGIGLIINSVIIAIDHFFFKIPHYIYLSFLILGIILIIIGVVKYKKVHN